MREAVTQGSEVVQRHRCADDTPDAMDYIKSSDPGGVPDDVSCVSTATSVSDAGLSVKGRQCPAQKRNSKTESLMERRKHAFKNRPSIDCSLVRSDESASCPFLAADPKVVADKFDVQEALGQGTTGVVFRAYRRSDRQQVALKIMRMYDEELLNIARQEYELLRSVSHPNIIRALDFFTYSMGAVLVLDHFDGINLEATVANAPNNCLEETTARVLFGALVAAVAYLHERSIVHRDIKAPNILVSHDLSDLRLVDFNTAQRVLEGGALTMTGTVDYLPPEVLLGDSLSQSSDMWAAGVCLHFMLSGTMPVERRMFSSRHCYAQAFFTQRDSLLSAAKWQRVSGQCKAVVRNCLEVDPQMRATGAQVLASDWLKLEAISL